MIDLEWLIYSTIVCITWSTFEFQLVSLVIGQVWDAFLVATVVFYFCLFVELHCSQCLSVKTREDWRVPYSHYDAPWRGNGVHGFCSPIWSSGAGTKEDAEHHQARQKHVSRGSTLRAAGHFEAQNSAVQWYRTDEPRFQVNICAPQGNSREGTVPA